MASQENLLQKDISVLYHNHHSWLLGWLRKKLGNSFDAADLAQDTFVRVMGKPSDTQVVREPRAWLTSIAHGLVVDHVRRQDVERAYNEVLSQIPEQFAPSPEVRFLFLEALSAIDALLDGLKPKVRSAFLMSRLEDMPYPAIAEQLGVSLSSVEKYMATALKHCYLFQRRQREQV